MSDFTPSIHTVERVLAVLKDLENVNFETLPAHKIDTYLAPVERLVATWEALPAELTQTVASIRGMREAREWMAWFNTLTPEQQEQVRAQVRPLLT